MEKQISKTCFVVDVDYASDAMPPKLLKLQVKLVTRLFTFNTAKTISKMPQNLLKTIPYSVLCYMGPQYLELMQRGKTTSILTGADVQCRSFVNFKASRLYSKYFRAFPNISEILQINLNYSKYFKKSRKVSKKSRKVFKNI